MQISERVKKIGRITKKILAGLLIAIGCGVVAVTIIIMVDNPTPEDPKTIAIHQEFLAQAAELDHRIKLCNILIDNTDPSTVNSAAAFHCGMMWEQMKKLEAFVTVMKLKEPETEPLIQRTMREAERYAEYQKAISLIINAPSHKLYHNL